MSKANGLRVAWFLAVCWAPAFASAATESIQIDRDDIGGVVSSAKGPEAGVWVIAQTTELGTSYVKIVSTDDHGRFVLPDLPAAKFKIWVRGYGLVDSQPTQAEPGEILKLSVVTAPNAAAAAEIYPPNYWFALIEAPPASEFPGTGPKGNGINPQFATRQAWMTHLKENCRLCHQLGNTVTRQLANIGDSVEAWNQRIHKARNNVSTGMINVMTQFGSQRALRMFAAWTDRIAAGQLPREVPPRPSGVERNAVITMWDWAAGRSVHDVISTDKRNPVINAAGPVYGASGPAVAILDPVGHKPEEHTIPGLSGLSKPASSHTPTMDSKRRVWNTIPGSEGVIEEFCTNANAGKFQKYFLNLEWRGRQLAQMRRISMFDPATKMFATYPVCFSSHHLAFDKNDTVYFSGDTEVIGWFDTRVYDETKDVHKAQGWCPYVLDTNGDGKITPDSNQWNRATLEYDLGIGGIIGGVVRKGDPSKDTQIRGHTYGINVNWADGSVWAAKYAPIVPSGIVRFEKGANPPETCKTEYYEPPKLSDGSYAAVNGRGVDIDSKGIVWIAYGNGQLASFDRRRCKVTSGPTALGQQCPEGWDIYDSPGPKITGETRGSADHHYLIFVDLENTFGLGKDIPILPGTNSDSMLAFLPDQKKWIVIRIPYPMGFYARGLDGRIDDPNGGWKRRGLWSNYATVAVWHQEGGEENPMSKVVHIQMRPDALAH